MPWWIAPGQSQQWGVPGAGSAGASAPSLSTPKDLGRGKSTTEQDEGFQAAASRLAGILHPHVPAPAGLSQAGPTYSGHAQETFDRDYDSAQLGALAPEMAADGEREFSDAPAAPPSSAGEVSILPADAVLTAHSGNGKDSLASAVEGPATLPAVAPASRVGSPIQPAVPSVQNAGLESRDAVLPAAAPDGDVAAVVAAPIPSQGVDDESLAAELPASAPAVGEDVLRQGSGDVPAPAMPPDAGDIPLPVHGPADAPVGTSSQDVDPVLIDSQHENMGQKAWPPVELAMPGPAGDFLDGTALLVEGPAPNDGIAEAPTDAPLAPVLAPSQSGDQFAHSGDGAASPAAPDASVFEPLANKARAWQADGAQGSPTQVSKPATLLHADAPAPGLPLVATVLQGSPGMVPGSEDLAAERAGTPDGAPTDASAPQTSPTDDHVSEASPAEASHVVDSSNEGRGPPMLPVGGPAHDAFPADAFAPATLPAESPIADNAPVEGPAALPAEFLNAGIDPVEGPAALPPEPVYAPVAGPALPPAGASTAGNEPVEGSATFPPEDAAEGDAPAEGPASLPAEAPTADSAPVEGPAHLSADAPIAAPEPVEGPATLPDEALNSPAEGPAALPAEASTAGNEPVGGPATLPPEDANEGDAPAEGPASLPAEAPTAASAPLEGPTALPAEAPSGVNAPAEGPSALPGEAPSAVLGEFPALQPKPAEAPTLKGIKEVSQNSIHP